MKFAQLNPDGSFDKELQPGNIVFDENNFCTAEALMRDGKAAQFRVVQLIETPAPDIDPITQVAVLDGAEFIENRWRQKWLVVNLSSEQIIANQIAAAKAMQQAIIDAMTELFDTTAQERRYDNRVTCALRAGYDGPFQAEGQAFATWMDSCNALGYAMLAEVQAGTRPMPATTEEALALLPPMVWPT